MSFVRSVSIALVLTVMFHASCSTTDVGDGPAAIELPTQTRVSHGLSADELAALRKFAEAYEPRYGHTVIPEPPELGPELTQVLQKAATSGTREHEKFLLLIFLRISRFQTENFNQTYELGRSNPLSIEFYRLIGRTHDYATAERMGASLADNHVEDHPELRQYRPIEVEIRRIDRAGERIKNELQTTLSGRRP